MSTLTGQVPVQIDHAYQITCYQVEVKETVPITFRAGAFGPIGIGKGIGPTTVTLQFAQRKGVAPEFGTIESLKATPHTITINPSSATTRLITGAELTDYSFRNDPASGSSDWSLTFTATENTAG